MPSNPTISGNPLREIFGPTGVMARAWRMWFNEVRRVLDDTTERVTIIDGGDPVPMTPKTEVPVYQAYEQWWDKTIATTTKTVTVPRFRTNSTVVVLDHRTQIPGATRDYVETGNTVLTFTNYIPAGTVLGMRYIPES